MPCLSHAPQAAPPVILKVRIICRRTRVLNMLLEGSELLVLCGAFVHSLSLLIFFQAFMPSHAQRAGTDPACVGQFADRPGSTALPCSERGTNMKIDHIDLPMTTAQCQLPRPTT